MTEARDSFDLEGFRLPESLLPRPLKETAPNNQHPYKAKSPKRIWCKFDYENQLGLSRKSRDPLIAVQAELYRLWFKLPDNDKSRPLELDNTVFKRLGFNHHDKHRALKCLENVGFIEMKQRRNRTPLIVVLHF